MSFENTEPAPKKPIEIDTVDNFQAFDVEETLRGYYMKRKSTGMIERFQHIGDGIHKKAGVEVGVFQRPATQEEIELGETASPDDPFVRRTALVDAVRDGQEELRIQFERQEQARLYAEQVELGHTSLEAIPISDPGLVAEIPTAIMQQNLELPTAHIETYEERRVRLDAQDGVDPSVVEPVVHEVVAAPVPAEQVETKSEKNAHLAAVFAPFVRPETPPSKVNLTDALLSKDDSAYPSALAELALENEANAPIIEQQKVYDKLVDDDTRDYSVQRLKLALRRDFMLEDILKEAGFKEASLDAVDAIRTDPDLRYKVAVHFMAKLNGEIANEPMNFGPRLLKNGQKVNAYVSQNVYTSSREYAVYLAVAKISGMFNYKAERDSDDTKYDERTGQPIDSQHRAAADLLL